MRTLFMLAILSHAAYGNWMLSEAQAEDTKVTKGMHLDLVLKKFRCAGLKLEETTGAVAPDNPTNKLREFVFHPTFRKDDALLISAESPVGEDDYKVTLLRWHLDWSEDTKYPHSLRDNRVLVLASVDTRALIPSPPRLKEQRKAFKQSPQAADPFKD